MWFSQHFEKDSVFRTNRPHIAAGACTRTARRGWSGRRPCRPPRAGPRGSQPGRLGRKSVQNTACVPVPGRQLVPQAPGGEVGPVPDDQGDDPAGVGIEGHPHPRDLTAWTRRNSTARPPRSPGRALFSGPVGRRLDGPSALVPVQGVDEPLQPRPRHLGGAGDGPQAEPLAEQSEDELASGVGHRAGLGPGDEPATAPAAAERRRARRVRAVADDRADGTTGTGRNGVGGRGCFLHPIKLLHAARRATTTE